MKLDSVRKSFADIRSPLQRRLALMRHRASRLDPTVKGLLWAILAGAMFVVLNTLLRKLTLQLHPLQVQFLRYAIAIVIMLPPLSSVFFEWTA